MCKGTKPESKCNHMNHAIKVHKSSQKQPRIGGLNLLSNKCIKRVSKLKVRGQGSTHQDMTYILKHVPGCNRKHVITNTEQIREQTEKNQLLSRSLLSRLAKLRCRLA